MRFIVGIASLMFFIFSPVFAVDPAQEADASVKQGPVTLEASIFAYWSKADDAYTMSMPLLAAALTQDSAFFDAHAADFEKAIDRMDNPSFQQWMLGRLLIAADSVGRVDVANRIANRMRLGLTKELYAPAAYSENTAFAAWALEYLQAHNALHDKIAYKKLKHIVNTALAYQQANATFSNKMWTYTMAIYAAALAGDHDAYGKYIIGMAHLDKKTHSVMGAIFALKAEDYPLWLSSLVQGSAELMQDAELSDTLLIAANASGVTSQDNMMGAATSAYFDRMRVKKSKVRLSFSRELLPSRG